MLQPLHRFLLRVGRLVLLDRAADPAAAGELQRNATHVKVYSGGAVRNLSDLHASSHTHDSHTGIGTGDHHAQAHAAAHQPAGADAMAVDAAAATGSLRTLGTGALQALAGNTVTGPARATQAAVEAQTNEATYVSPDLVHKNLGVVKVYGRMNAAGTLTANSRNVTSVTKGATGTYTVNFTTNFSNENFWQHSHGISTAGYFGDMAGPTVGQSGEYVMRFHDGVATDVANGYMAVGDQV